jgi:hypothetical protein
MAHFFGCNLEQKPQIDRTVLRWLKGLDNRFNVFIETEGSDFSVDFLVLKATGIFDVEAKDWNVREANADADWVLMDGATRKNPFLYQVLDQCTKVFDYLTIQKDDIFGSERAKVFFDERNAIRIFPVIAISYANFTGQIALHKWRRIFADPHRLLTHIRHFEWFPNMPKAFSLETTDIEKIADLLHLSRVDPDTLQPLSNGAVAVSVPVAHGIAIVRQEYEGLDDATLNPYQYTYTVTGDGFYGRDIELRKVKRALSGGQPIAIIGLQRTGKSSLANESIRRYIEGSPQYLLIEYDFRRLKDEAPQQEEDLTLEFIRMMPEIKDTGVEQALQKYSLAGKRPSLADQRRMFRDLLRKNRERNRRTILFLDECQEIEDFLNEDRYKSFFIHLDALCRERDLALSVVIACRPAFFEFSTIRETNLGRLFETIWLGTLEDEPAMGIINRGSPYVDIEDSAAARIRFLTGNHAFWLQFLCHRLFEECVLSKKRVLTCHDVDRVFQGILMDVGCKAQFYLLYQDIEHHPPAFNLLKKIAEAAVNEESAVDIGLIHPEWRDRPDFPEALRVLQDNQVISIGNDHVHPMVSFRVEALRCWLRCHLLTA